MVDTLIRWEDSGGGPVSTNLQFARTCDFNLHNTCLGMEGPSG